MWNYIREKLGLNMIEVRNKLLTSNNQALRMQVDHLTRAIMLQNAALARIIAKLDPLYDADELDPSRKAASDAISARIIAKLNGELAEQQRMSPK